MSYRYHRPRDASEVDDLLYAHGADARILAGGTDLLVQMREGSVAPRHVIDISGLEELSLVESIGDRLKIGAVSPLWKLTESTVVRSRFGALADAAKCVGSKQIQNRATIVGNICNASPAADTGPALLVYDAMVGIRSALGRRRLSLGEFWLRSRETALDPREWVEYVELRDAGCHGSSYVKLGRTRGVDLAIVGVAVLATDSDFRLAYASVAPTVIRATVTERVLDPSLGVDQVWDDVTRSLATEIHPIDDVRASAQYRSAMAVVCTRRGVAVAHQRLSARESSGD